MSIAELAIILLMAFGVGLISGIFTTLILMSIKYFFIEHRAFKKIEEQEKQGYSYYSDKKHYDLLGKIDKQLNKLPKNKKAVGKRFKFRSLFKK